MIYDVLYSLCLLNESRSIFKSTKEFEWKGSLILKEQPSCDK